MGQADEASPVFPLNFRRAVVEQPAVLQRRVPSQNTSLHGDIDPCPIHVLDLRVEIEELGMNVGFGNAVFFDDGSSFRVDPHSSRQLHGNIVMFKINDHKISPLAKKTQRLRWKWGDGIWGYWKFGF